MPRPAVSRLTAPFTDHPASAGESYGAHMVHALSFAGGLAVAAGACLVHAFLPFLCVTSGSRRITALHERMVTNRGRTPPLRIAPHAQKASAGAVRVADRGVSPHRL